MITREELLETARLAHLTLDEAELERLFPAFEQALEFFAAMQAAGQASVLDRIVTFPLANIAGRVNSQGFRFDNVNNAHHTASNGLNPNSQQENSQIDSQADINLVHNAGERDGRFIVVPNVL